MHLDSSMLAVGASAGLLDPSAGMQDATATTGMLEFEIPSQASDHEPSPNARAQDGSTTALRPYTETGPLERLELSPHSATPLNRWNLKTAARFLKIEGCVNCWGI